VPRVTTVHSSELAVEVCIDGGRLAVAVRGEIDMESAPLLRTVMRGLIDGGHKTAVLDFENVSFMDAAGIGVIVEAAGRLTAAGGSLAIRSAPPMTLLVLQITRVSELVQFENPDLAVAHAAVDQTVEDAAAMIGREPVAIVSDLVKVGSMVTATALVDRALQLVTVLAKAAIDGADGVSVSLERHERISTVAWSNDTVLQMDLHQYQTGEGPCVDAANTGRGFHIDSLADEDRWPAFVPRAMEEGIASILSTPLTTPARSVGALNIYSNSEGAFGEPQMTLAGLFAEQASGIITASLTDQDAGTRLAQALVDREVIAQAQGVLMGRNHVSAVDAAGQLFSAARAAELTVSQYAANVVASTEPEASGE